MLTYTSNISWQYIHNEIFVFDEISGDLFVFRKYSKDIWLFIDCGLDVEEIINNLVKKYDISSLDAQAIVERCVCDFKKKRLVNQE